MNTRVAVIIPAAGAGSRLGGTRKQFRLLGGRPVLIRTLEVFIRLPEVTSVVVAIPSGEEALVRQQVAQYGLEGPVQLVEGGATRQASVARALEQVVPLYEEMPVLVHDAVRPFVREEEIRRVITAIKEAGAAALAVPVVDTLRRGKDRWFGETVPREGLLRMQTPQGARYSLLAQAFEWARRRHVEATDEVALLQEIGVHVRWIRGTPFNIKITTAEDWSFAQQFWPCWEQWKG